MHLPLRAVLGTARQALAQLLGGRLQRADGQSSAHRPQKCRLARPPPGTGQPASKALVERELEQGLVQARALEALLVPPQQATARAHAQQRRKQRPQRHRPRGRAAPHAPAPQRIAGRALRPSAAR